MSRCRRARPRRRPWLRRLRRPLLTLLPGWLRQLVTPRPRRRTLRPPPDPSPGAAAFRDGMTIRQVAYLVGDQDPGIIDPRADWPGAVADAHGVGREYIVRLEGYIGFLMGYVHALEDRLKKGEQ